MSSERSDGSMATNSIPSHGRSTRPWSISSRTTRLAVSIGTAKPMPTEPVPPTPVAIWELMPITRPPASISGPPELPGLIAASVWMTFSIV